MRVIYVGHMSRTNTINVACGRCDGSGKISLPFHLAQTAGQLGAEWLTSSAIQKKMRKIDDTLKRGAILQRLRRLRDLGVVEARGSQDDPREFDWRLTSAVHA